MGSGKSTVGKLLSVYLGWDFIDVDKVIEEREGMKIRDIFKKKGEDYFRNVEMKTLKNLLKYNKKVIATGGGLGANEKAMKLMKEKGIVVWLDIPYEEFLRRCKKDGSRPLLQKRTEELKDIFEKRKKIYEKAHIRIDACQSPAKVMESIIDKLPWKG